MSNHPKLHLLNVEELPRSRTEVNQAITTGVIATFASCMRLSPLSSDAEALTHIRDALNVLSMEIVAMAIDNGWDSATGNGTADEYDDYFGVVRVSGNPLHMLLYSILEAYSQLLEETLALGTSLDPREWRRLRTAFDAMLHALAQEPDNESADALPVDRFPLLSLRSPFSMAQEAWATHAARPAVPHIALPRKEKGWVARVDPPRKGIYARNALDPMRRWRIGHHVFFTLIQSLVVTFHWFGSAIAAADLDAAQAALELAATLMWGSAAAFRFAGDFPPEEYDEVVRPSMMPPNLAPGFSGLMSTDHQYLVKLLTQLRPVFVNLEPCLHRQHRQFTRAFAAAYEAHKFVCAQFKGNEVPSLRMSLDASISAVDELDHLKRSRLRLVKQ